MADQEKPKIGLDAINFEIKGEVFLFRSALTYDSTNNESLLHLLWRYQGRMDQFTLTCLNVLINIITSQESIMEFFSNLPGPTYQFARYTDWIGPYLTQQKMRVENLTYSQTSREEIVKMIS